VRWRLEFYPLSCSVLAKPCGHGEHVAVTRSQASVCVASPVSNSLLAFAVCTNGDVDVNIALAYPYVALGRWGGGGGSFESACA
jgi:hypothetical protein